MSICPFAGVHLIKIPPLDFQIVLDKGYSLDEAFQDLGDLVEYEPTVVNASRNFEELLTRIAGGDYWKDIVRDYPHKINGY